MDELQAGVKITRRNNNLRYADATSLVAESEEELKSLLMIVKEDNEKSGLKLNIKKKKTDYGIWAWQIKGKGWKQWQISSSWGLKSLHMVTAAMSLEDDSFLAEELWQT